VAEDCAIWLVEDKNQTVIRIDRAEADPPPLLCDARSPVQVDQLAAFAAGNAQARDRLSAPRKNLVEKHCLGCHADSV
jgi:hypothetical protein